MDIVTRGLDSWFFDKLQGLQYSQETLAYVVGVMKAQSRPNVEDDFSKKSLVLELNSAMISGKFVQYQRLGDWCLWALIIVPEHLESHRDVAENVGIISYQTCNRILDGKWYAYEELAVKFSALVKHVRSRLV